MNKLLKTIVLNLPALKQLTTTPKTYQKEIAHVSIALAANLVYTGYASCGSLTCVPAEHWLLLVTAVVALIARLKAKQEEKPV